MLQNIKCVPLVAPGANALAGTITTTALNLKNFESCKFLVNKGAGATGTQTLTVEKCDDAAGTNPVAIPFKYRKSSGATGTSVEYTDAVAAGFTTTAEANDLYEIEITHQMEGVARGDKPYFRVKSVEVVASAVGADIIAILSGSRYGSDASVA